MDDKRLPLDLDGKTRHAQTKDALRSLALALSNFLVYGPMHHLTEASFNDCWEQLTRFWETQGMLFLGVGDSKLVVNEYAFSVDSQNMRALEQAMEARKMTAVKITPGCTSYEMKMFLEILSMSPVSIEGHGGIEAFFKKKQVDHIQLSNAHYELVSPPPGRVSAVPESQPAKRSAPENPEYDTALLLAYLGSDTDTFIDKAADAAEALAQDPQLIAEMIFDAATAKSPEAEGCDFQTLAKCVKKTLNLLVNSQSGKTPEGRIMLINAMDDLKNELLYSVKSEDGKDTRPGEILAELVEDAKERLGIDKLITDYALKREMLTGMENRILEVMRNKGFGLSGAELEHRMKQQGLTDELWDELWIKSMVKTLGGTAPESGDAVTHFEEFMRDTPLHGDTGDPDYITELISQITDVELEINALIEQTRVRMDQLDKVFADALGEANGPSRDHVLDLARNLLIIGRGLSDPAKMINTAIEIVRCGQAGPLTEAQHALLQLAAVADTKLQGLTRQLMALAEANQT
ncbi:MAG: hypothetical protein RRC34_08340 [Lentisphaeria bacterium]|nr:hypothetical protein [Lentisphaeria bacterium]